MEYINHSGSLYEKPPELYEDEFHKYMKKKNKMIMKGRLKEVQDLSQVDSREQTRDKHR